MLASLQDWQHHGQTHQYKSYPVFFRDDGRGPATLLIHGFPTASWDWHKLWPRLSQHARCITADMLGFGFSAKPRDHAYSIQDQADLFEDLLASRGVDQVHVLAHDYGDSVAQELLARFLERERSGESGLRLLSVCLLNGGLFPETHHALPVQKLLNSPAGPLVSRLMNRRAFKRSFAAVFGPQSQPGADELEAFWQLLSLNGGTRIAHKLIRYINERQQQRERWVGALQQARIPVRLINGPLDPISGLHMTRRYRELVPQADIVLLEQIGHYPQVEAPTATLAAYRAFLDNSAITPR